MFAITESDREKFERRLAHFRYSLSTFNYTGPATKTTVSEVTLPVTVQAAIPKLKRALASSTGISDLHEEEVRDEQAARDSLSRKLEHARKRRCQTEEAEDRFLKNMQFIISKNMRGDQFEAQTLSTDKPFGLFLASTDFYGDVMKMEREAMASSASALA